MLCKRENFTVQRVCYHLAVIITLANLLLLAWCCCVGFLWLIGLDVIGISEESVNHGPVLGMKIGGIRFKRDFFSDMMTHGPKPGPDPEPIIKPFHNVWKYWLPILTVASLLNFISSALLCVGISKCRPKYVKVYLIYGSIITVLAVVASILQYYPMLEPEIGSWGLFGCCLHSLFLVLVYNTHTRLLDENHGDHVPLEEIDTRVVKDDVELKLNVLTMKKEHEYAILFK